MEKGIMENISTDKIPEWKDCIGKKVVLLNKQACVRVEETGMVLELMENGGVARVLWDNGEGIPIGFIHTKLTDKWELLRIVNNGNHIKSDKCSVCGMKLTALNMSDIEEDKCQNCVIAIAEKIDTDDESPNTKYMSDDMLDHVIRRNEERAQGNGYDKHTINRSNASRRGKRKGPYNNR